jgi:ribosomal protein L16 Arg81 hydroxylase
MEAQDQSYVLNLQISKMEKKMDARLSNDEDVGTLLKKRLEEMEKEKKYFENQIGDHENTIARFEIENERKSKELLEAESWKVENVELKRKWGVLSVKVQHLEAELNNAYNKIHALRSLPEEQAKDAMVMADKERLEEENKELQIKLADLEKEHGILVQNYDKSSEVNQFKMKMYSLEPIVLSNSFVKPHVFVTNLGTLIVIEMV